MLIATSLCIIAHVHAFAPASTLTFTSKTNPYELKYTRTAFPLHVASSSSQKDSVKQKNTNSNVKGEQEQPGLKLPHDRTIDRRKSPALWRYDLEYSIAPSGQVASNQKDKSFDKYAPKAPPELMSPAGGWPQLKAAVANGADAVYLGLTSYSARARAANFDPDPRFLLEDSTDKEYDSEDGEPASLAHAVQFAHKYNVRVYVAFNTLVFDEELHEVQELIEQVWDCGVDAVIVQDIGVAKIVKEVVDRLSKSGSVGMGLDGAPLEIHASTQQTVTCADGVSFAAERTNATRVVSLRDVFILQSLTPRVFITRLHVY